MNDLTRPPPVAHPAFSALRQVEIEALNISVQQYEHRATGALHYHLAADNVENVFLVALRTVPEDSTGVAHILEHTALCGSERYPVRDPFFMMLRRSLNTFMNAFTSSDWTAYPFASQNRKDFDNLLNVYLDAVFFSRLDPLDFAQEGHRLEFAQPDDPDSNLVYKGVVFNEMKGAMSSVTSTLWHTLCEQLFPTSTYHYNSGGDPEDIPALSYEQLKDFYASHYHPSNAVFMTFGDIPAPELQGAFEERALGRFQRLEQRIEVKPERRLVEPVHTHGHYAFDESDDVHNRTHIVMGWMLGESTDLGQLLEARLLASTLIDNSASPLLHLLETTPLGQAPSPLCGLEDSMREMVFCCGIEGSEPGHAGQLEEEVLAVLRRVAEEGVPRERLEAALHQLELHQREISGDGYPYGLQLILQALAGAIHHADPIALLDLDPVIDNLRSQIRDPDYIKRLARDLLLDNSHRVTLVLEPDPGLSAARAERERKELAAIKEKMADSEKAATVALADALKQRQQQLDDEDILPRVELSDVSPTIPDLDYLERELNGLKVTTYGRGTNGLTYLQLVRPLPQLSMPQLEMLPLYSHALTELGVGEDSYLETQHRQSATVGAINAFTSMRGAVHDEQTLQANFVLSSKALMRNSDAQAALMADTLSGVRFDELDRIRDLVSQQRAGREQALTGNGHGLAMSAACARMSPLAGLNHRLSGLEGLASLRRLDESLDDRATLEACAGDLASLHEALRDLHAEVLYIAEEHHVAELAAAAAETLASTLPRCDRPALDLEPLRESVGELWLANTQVNFCARAYPTVPTSHPDAAPLVVLGGFLRNGFLHRAIREQGGAYGGGASQDSGIAAFRFYSYRDPRLEETLADFDTAITWFLDNTHSFRALEEAILGVVSSLDRPGSPAGEAKQHFHNRLFGRDHRQRQAFRQAVLDVTLTDMQKVAEKYLRPELASTAVISSAAEAAARKELGARLGLTIRQLA